MKEKDELISTQEANGCVQSTEASSASRRKRNAALQIWCAMSVVYHAPRTFMVTGEGALKHWVLARTKWILPMVTLYELFEESEKSF